MEQAQNQMARQQQQMLDQQRNLVLEQAKQSPWFITEQEQEKYGRIFNFFDQSKQGYLTDVQAQEAFSKTLLPKEVLASVWELVNSGGNETFDQKMFWMAMHLLS